MERIPTKSQPFIQVFKRKTELTTTLVAILHQMIFKYKSNHLINDREKFKMQEILSNPQVA